MTRSDLYIRRIRLLGFVAEVAHIHANMPDRRFCFVLGAGASKPSGIPTAGELGLDWLRRIHLEREGQSRNFDNWLADGVHGIQDLPLGVSSTDVARIAAAYPAIYRGKWGHDRAQGDAELERHIEAAKASYGYYALAEILSLDDGASSRHNVVITPNFDNLVAETLGALGKKVPIVIGHSAIAAFARPTLRRPLVIKFHHDFLLAPKSDPSEIGTIDTEYGRALSEVLRLYTPIVVGYGGNDGSLMGLFEQLDRGSLPGGLYWCWRTGDPPSERIDRVVAKQAGTLVEIPGFDELMALLEGPFGHSFDPERLRTRANERVTELAAARDALRARGEIEIAPSPMTRTTAERRIRTNVSPLTSEESTAILDALSSAPSANRTDPAAEQSTPWWHWQHRVNATADPKEKERLYLAGIAEVGEVPQLLASYASFLSDVAKDQDRAAQIYERAIAAEPTRVESLRSYAVFLEQERKDYDRSEAYYQKALAADPSDAKTLGNYADFLEKKRRDYDRAEEYYQRAIAADPSYTYALAGYAVFLETQRKNYDRAEEYYQRSLAVDPKDGITLGNYADFLDEHRKNYDRAEEYYEKAIAAGPVHAQVLINYAVFLENKRKDYDRAEEYYQRAIAADGADAANLRRFADFVEKHRHDPARAKEYRRRAALAE
ncbi:MAG TPA: tetratricopeptide repeat protein [Vicinamibacterales bacterium]|nr:tetratricopeptide repeat protein [Vicinamibacterales bacterium]